MNIAKPDPIAIGLSGLCILHCLALPVLASILPMLGAVAEAEWLHRIFVIGAIVVGGYAFVTMKNTSTRLIFAATAVIGLALLVAGAFVEAFHDYEVLLTVIGAVVLIVAHMIRWRGEHSVH